MSIEQIFTHRLEVGRRTIQYARTLSAGAQSSAEEVIADSTTDKQVVFAIDFSQIVGLWISSDQDVTIETNDGTTPDDTINLTADNPLIWTSDSYFACPLTADVTDLYITNASGKEATVKIEVLYDSTP